MKNLAIIPARGGSKRIPRKNIKPFMGKPIIAYSIEAALQSGLFDEVMVSTDDEEIADIARQYGASVPFMRSTETANDYASTEDVVLEVLSVYKSKGKFFTAACCIYSTAPFVSYSHLKEAYEKLICEDLDTVFPVVAYSYPVQRSLEIIDDKVQMVYPEYTDSRSQDLQVMYHDAGQFYFFQTSHFLQNKQLWTSKTGTLILSELEVQDLDTEIDWNLAELKYQLYRNK